MRITITPIAAGTSAQPFLLGDDTQPNVAGPTSANPSGATGLIEKGFLPSLAVATERDELINAPFAVEVPRGNLQLTYAWQVMRVFDTPDNCAMFLADHPTLLPTSGQLAVTIATTVRYLDNAVLKDYRTIEHTGKTCVVSYTYAGSFVPPLAGAAGTGTGGPFTSS